MRVLAEIDGAHALVRCDRLGAPRSNSRPATSTEMRRGEGEHEVHVVLDQQDRDVRRQRGEGGENIAPLLLGHARGGLVEQQYARAGGQRERDLEQTLLAIGKLARRLVAARLEAEAA